MLPIKNSLIQTNSHIKNASLDNAMIGNHASLMATLQINRDYSVLEVIIFKGSYYLFLKL
jgi:glucose-1-phosphate thymidylyltransferase